MVKVLDVKHTKDKMYLKEGFIMDSDILIMFSPLLFIIGWQLFVHIKKFYLSKDMFKKIGWIVIKENNMRCYSNNVRLRSKELISYFYEEQRNLNIPDNLQLDYSNEVEKVDAEKILEAHRNHVIKSYFSDDLIKNKNIYSLNSLEYYMYSLHCFLHPEITKHRDNRDKIYSFKSADKPYSHYTLTDYGRTYYKLYLITLMFLEKNEKTQKLFEYIDPKHKNHIIDDLQNNETSFVRFGY